MAYKTALAKARGLGAAHKGTEHWWMQRITAVALIPLSFWLILFLQQVFYRSYAEILDWLSAPLNLGMLIAWLLAACYHAALGLQVVIEDYISPEGWKISLVWAVKLGFASVAIIALVLAFHIAGAAG